MLVALFAIRFDPDFDRHADRGLLAKQAIADIEGRIDLVESLNEDRVLRSLLRLVTATLRTNYYQPHAADGGIPRLALKLDPRSIPDLPLPRPMFEIFVYSPRVEGVHLRGGPVARGGLRWSDRPEDFRTEILGLAKAQTVKNAVIVPVGAKGGFVVKSPPPGRDALYAEVASCYRTFVRGLLDVTDNLVDGRVVPPDRVVRHDGDDPYLVVAADKGTATFSDMANAISRRVRVLARGRLRLRRVEGLRPQGDGDHRPRRLGVGAAALPGPRRRRAERGLHRGGHRGHVR